MRESDSVLIPVFVDKDTMVIALQSGDSGSAPPTERKMGFLVHLEVKKLAVTVYTE